MIDNISSLILEKRKLFVFIILMITGFMAYMSQFVQLNYDFSQTVPDSDPDMIYYSLKILLVRMEMYLPLA